MIANVYSDLRISHKYGGKMSKAHIFAVTFTGTTECISMRNLFKLSYLDYMYYYCEKYIHLHLHV